MFKPPAPVGYSTLFDGPKRRAWRIGICGCFGARDAGPNCCCAHCCCGSRIWYEALKVAGVKEDLIRSVASMQDQAQALRAQSGPEGAPNPFAQALAVAPATNAAWSGSKLREELSKILFGNNNQLSPTQDWLAHSLCLPCGRCQEVDAVMTYAYEAHGRSLHYGNWTSCQCAEFRDPSYTVVRKLPPRPAERPLLPGQMERA